MAPIKSMVHTQPSRKEEAALSRHRSSRSLILDFPAFVDRCLCGKRQDGPRAVCSVQCAVCSVQRAVAANGGQASLKENPAGTITPLSLVDPCGSVLQGLGTAKTTAVFCQSLLQGCCAQRRKSRGCAIRGCCGPLRGGA